MKTKQNRLNKEGAILAVVMIILLFLSILILSLFNIGRHNARETDYELKSTQAFWLAEAGRQWCIADLYAGNNGLAGATAVGADVPGTYEVIADGSNARICIGSVAVPGKTIRRRIRLELSFVARPFEHAVYAGNDANVPWTFKLRGTGSSVPPAPLSQGTHYPGGRDSVLGDLDINGDVRLDEASFIGVPTPNNYNVLGNLGHSGAFFQGTNATLSGSDYLTFGSSYNPPDLAAMQYQDDNDYNIAQIFIDEGVLTSGRLPADHPLHDVVVKNPADRAAQNALTPGDDFYFEPASYVSAGNNPSTAVTPLLLGDNKVYYVDGQVWFNKSGPYGFEVDGQATIVSTRDIHISDNLAYKNRTRTPVNGNEPDLLALVALGQYNSVGARISDGNIYFGDPAYGTLYTCDAFMFANNDFYYNTSSNDPNLQKEPESGFKIFGNFMAVNQVQVLRDWYDDSSGNTRAADYVYDTVNSRWIWVDAMNHRANPTVFNELSSSEVSTIRHYAVQVEYDDRIRDAATQMDGLPEGSGTIFSGLKKWKEISPQ